MCYLLPPIAYSHRAEHDLPYKDLYALRIDTHLSLQFLSMNHSLVASSVL